MGGPASVERPVRMAGQHGSTGRPPRGENVALHGQAPDPSPRAAPRLGGSGTTAAERRSLEQTRAGLAFKEPKTARGERVLALPRIAVQALLRHKGEQAEQRLLLGLGPDEQALVCSHLDGSPIPPDYISDNFRWRLDKAKLPRVRFHGLRHTCATLLLQEGVHPKVVSEMLGHSTVSITLDVYSHVLPSMQEEAARKLDNALRAAITNDRRED